MRQLIFAFFLVSMGFFAACGNNQATTEAEGTTTEAATEATDMAEEGVNAAEAETMEVDETGPEYTSAYVCPMHCKGSGSDAPGTCPVCGMEYVANPAQGGEQMEAGEGQDSHEGHNH